VAHSGNATKVGDDLRASIQAGYEQGERARRHLMSAKAIVPLFDKNGKVVAEVNRAEIKSAHVLVVTWESLCPLSIDLKPWLDVDATAEYPWVIWVDDLQTALTRLRPATEIAKYIAWRSTLNGRLVAGDEMNVVGCFLAKHLDFPAEFDTIAIDGGYAAIFDDDYFARQGIKRAPNTPDDQPSLIRLSHEDGKPVARLMQKKRKNKR
jgi:hypothetical protein